MSQRPRRPQLDPREAALVRAQLSRRSVLTGMGALGLGAGLAACGTGGTPGTSGSSDAKPSAPADTSDTDKVVNWANWTLYLDYDDKSKTYPTLKAFEKQTGIKATYAEDIEDNDTYYGKIQGQLKNGQDIGKDIVVFTDWMASRMVRLGYAQKLDKAVIPNASNLNDSLLNVDFDRGRNYSLTWQSGYAGLAWNKKAVPGGLKNVSDLWNNPDLKGRVEVLSEFRDTVGLIMMEQGADITGAFTAEEFGKGLDELEKQINSGQIRQVKGNSYKEDLISGDALAVIGWSGDITQINFENGDKWKFALPESGGTLWSDNLMVPIGSPHKKNAEILMNYYYDPKVAAKVAAYVNYVCPVKGAQAEMEKIDPSLAKDDSIFPSDEYLKKVHIFRSLTPAEETEYTADFQKVLGV
jgi:spermidine/putrescine transport system substrate-binding protein